ncbi:MAG: DUF2321 domain-containing protein [Candidatus Eremiobacteraeota bacterium]|nr:DUF2321 domain-containing protein [Candidatus Eremiobacteraeota bacterium]
MGPDEPIELPGLSAQRRGPSAAVCASGHVLAWFVEGPIEETYCPKCGDPILFACEACGRPLPPDAEMLQWVPYHGNCIYCGQPYPWRAAEIERAKRSLAEYAETEHWSEPVQARANELLADVAADRIAPSAVVAGVKWLEQHAGEHAPATILDAIERLGSATLKQALRPSFPGIF